METVRIVIEIEGGMVRGIYAEGPCVAAVVDYDCQEIGESYVGIEQVLRIEELDEELKDAIRLEGVTIYGDKEV